MGPATVSDRKKTRRVLVVDDEHEMRYLARAFLEHAFPGIIVVTANDGPAALRLLEETRFDAILSDQRMPGMDGLTFLSKTAPHVPPGACILMTAYLDQTLQERAQAAGMRFIEKSGDPENVVHAIRDVFAAAATHGRTGQGHL